MPPRMFAVFRFKLLLRIVHLLAQSFPTMADANTRTKLPLEPWELVNWMHEEAQNLFIGMANELARRGEYSLDSLDSAPKKVFEHLPKQAMVQMLKASRAPKVYIDAAKAHRCAPCETTKPKPPTHKVPMPKPYKSNSEIGVDVFDIKDAAGTFYDIGLC